MSLPSSFISFTYPGLDSTGSSSIDSTDNPVFSGGLYDQLETDANSVLISRYYATIDQALWNDLSNEIATLVNDANAGDISAEAKSLIYGRIMIIITAQYLPTVADFLGDSIAEQAATENIASDISAFLLDAQNGFNSLSTDSEGVSVNGSPTVPASVDDLVDDGNDAETLFDSVMGLAGNSVATSGQVPSSASSSSTPVCTSAPAYNYSFEVTYYTYNPADQTFVQQQASEDSVLGFLVDTNVWGNTTPISSSVQSQILSAMQLVVSAFNGGIQQGTIASSGDSPTTVGENAWLCANLVYLNYEAYWWQVPYGATTLEPIETTTTTNAITGETTITAESGNAPLVYTQPGTVQENINQAAEAVQTVATATQTVENFQIQEIDQFYGIINSIQQSQEQQCAAIVKKQGGG